MVAGNEGEPQLPVPVTAAQANMVKTFHFGSGSKNTMSTHHFMTLDHKFRQSGDTQTRTSTLSPPVGRIFGLQPTEHPSFYLKTHLSIELVFGLSFLDRCRPPEEVRVEPPQRFWAWRQTLMFASRLGLISCCVSVPDLACTSVCS